MKKLKVNSRHPWQRNLDQLALVIPRPLHAASTIVLVAMVKAIIILVAMVTAQALQGVCQVAPGGGRWRLARRIADKGQRPPGADVQATGTGSGHSSV